MKNEDERRKVIDVMLSTATTAAAAVAAGASPPRCLRHLPRPLRAGLDAGRRLEASSVRLRRRVWGPMGIAGWREAPGEHGSLDPCFHPVAPYPPIYPATHIGSGDGRGKSRSHP